MHIDINHRMKTDMLFRNNVHYARAIREFKDKIHNEAQAKPAKTPRAK